MVDINSWLEIFSERLESTFHNRIWFIGLQGSYARGEAKETSDIDMDDAIRRAVRSGACSIYHACVHNFLHERDSHILEGLYKSAAFVIQASYFMETRHYVASHRELSEIAGNYDREILCPAHGLSFDELSAKLFVWAVRKISDGKQE